MKKIIFSFCLLITVTLILSGCVAPKKPAETGNNESSADDSTQPGTDNNSIDTGNNNADLDISQADIDKLKSDIESMEYEDLNALTK